MAKYTHARNNFLLGEVSPRSLGRTDLEQYNQMCEYLKNFNVLPQGGARKRKGTSYVLSLHADHNLSTLTLIPFKGTTNYVFIVSSGRIDMVNSSNGTVVDNSSTGYVGGNAISYTQFGNFLVLTNSTTLPLILYVTPGTGFDQYNWGETEYSAAKGTGAYSTKTNEGHRNLPWFPENTTATTVEITSGTAAIGAGKTLTASAAIFSAGMVGDYIRVRHTADVGVAKITGYTSTTVVTIEIVRTFGATTATDDWSFCQWNNTQGFPRTCSFFQERIYFFGNGGFPDRIWGSQIGDLYELSHPDPTDTAAVGDDSSFHLDATLGSGGLSAFLSPGKNLFLGTSTREAIANEIDENIAMGVLNTKIIPQTQEGALISMPQRVENRLVFINKSSQKLIETTFNFDEDMYEILDLNFFADHFFAPGLIETTTSMKQINWQADTKTMWVVTSDFQLFSVSRDPKTGLIAWSRHVIGGTASTATGLTNTTTPAVLSSCSVPNGQWGFDETFVIVCRRVNGSNVRYLEKMSIHPTDSLTEVSDQYLDCSIRAVGSSATSWPAIAAHLPSETVHVIADGIYVGTKTLNGSGDLTLDTAATDVSVGYNYEAKLVTSELQSNALFGSGLGQTKRTSELSIVFSKTSSCEFGTEENESDLEAIPFRDATVSASDPTPLFDGTKVVKLRANYEKTQKIVLFSDEPLPTTVVAVVAKGVLYD